MIRGGSTRGRIAALVACAAFGLALTASATAGAQPAVDEYTLDLPGGGSDSADPTAPALGSSASGGGGTGGTGGTGGGTDPTGGASGSGNGAKGDESAQQSGNDANIAGLDQLHDSGSRSAPEVVADTLFDSAMLPILAVLVLITAAGAWRVLRNRRTLSRHAA